MFVDAAVKPKRTCSHFVHTSCAKLWMDQSPHEPRKCWTCGTPFQGLVPVPDVTKDPAGWFEVVDKDGNGLLDRQEIIAALASTLKSSVDKDGVAVLKEQLEKKFPSGEKSEWDPNGDGTIDKKEMLRAGGLYDYLHAELTSLESDAPPELSTGPEWKDVTASFEPWFQHYDKDKSGTLDIEEIIRALVKELNLSSEDKEKTNKTITNIRNYLLEVAPMAFGKSEFSLEDLQKEGGLGQTIVEQKKANQ